jgi:site-specific DNA recombinase
LQDKIKPQGQKIIDDQIPLRGYILCQSCGGLHTGGKSKGRTKYYYYYRCKKCTGENYKAEVVHNEIATILNSLSLSPNLLEKLRINTEIRYKEALKDRQISLKRVQSEFEVANEKLSSLEEKFITNKINQETYDKWYPIFSRDVNIKTGEIKELSRDNTKQFERLMTVIPYLGDLNKVYEIADVDDKQALLKEIFWGGFTKEKTGGRTKILNPIFEPNRPEINNLLVVEETKKFGNLPNFPDCTREGT